MLTMQGDIDFLGEEQKSLPELHGCSNWIASILSLDLLGYYIDFYAVR